MWSEVLALTDVWVSRGIIEKLTALCQLFQVGAMLEVVSSLKGPECHLWPSKHRIIDEQKFHCHCNDGRSGAFLLCVFPVQHHIWVSQSDSERFDPVQIQLDRSVQKCAWMAHVPHMGRPCSNLPLCVPTFRSLCTSQQRHGEAELKKIV